MEVVLTRQWCRHGSGVDTAMSTTAVHVTPTSGHARSTSTSYPSSARAAALLHNLLHWAPTQPTIPHTMPAYLSFSPRQPPGPIIGLALAFPASTAEHTCTSALNTRHKPTRKIVYRPTLTVRPNSRYCSKEALPAIGTFGAAPTSMLTKY